MVEYQTSFPRISHDPLEQLLVEEAVLLRFGDEQRELRDEEQARQDAHDQGRRALGMVD